MPACTSRYSRLQLCKVKLYLSAFFTNTKLLPTCLDVLKVNCDVFISIRSWLFVSKAEGMCCEQKKNVLSCLLHFSFYAPIVNAFFPPSTDPYKLVSLFHNGMATPQVSNCHGVPSECMTRINHVAYLGLDCEYSSCMGVFSFLARPRIFFTVPVQPVRQDLTAV